VSRIEALTGRHVDLEPTGSSREWRVVCNSSAYGCPVRDPLLFDRWPERYRRARPAYPQELWELLTELGIARSGAHVLDIGAGTGQVTGPLVRMGATVDAIEPGPGLTSLLLRAFPNVDVQACRAEEATYPQNTYDGVLCGTALHWLDLAHVLPRVRDSLRPDAGFVPFWHVFFDPDSEPTPFREFVNQMFGGPPSIRGTPLDEAHWLSELTKDGLFLVDSVHSWRFEHHMDAHAFTDLASTWNGWTEENISAAAQVVTRLGGAVTEHYMTVAYVCYPLRD
jgi:SAM-dependent methyltransferase